MQRFLKPSKPCHVGIHCIALAEYSQMSTHVPGFQPFLRIFASFCTSHNLDTSSIRVNIRDIRWPELISTSHVLTKDCVNKNIPP